MSHLFYHGFEPWDYVESIQHMIEIINSGGLKKRNTVINLDDDNLSHICLYRKNESFDYNAPNSLQKSARGGWIDSCMVFVVSSDISASYLPPNIKKEGYGLKTNLVDEWRCFEDIPLDKIIGVAIPLNSIKDALDGKDEFYNEEEITRLKEKLIELKEICDKLNLRTFNSEIKNFTDKIDEQYFNKTICEETSLEI